jgi:hypothetical protein
MSVPVCLPYLKTQRCSKGNSCKFLHLNVKETPSETSTKTEDTLHQAPETGPSKHASPSNNSSGAHSRRRVCFFFGTPRGCSKGDQCSFSHLKESTPVDSTHGDPTSNSNPPFGYCFIFWFKGNCTRGDECKFKHIERPGTAGEQSTGRQRRQPPGPKGSSRSDANEPMPQR